MGFFKGSQTLQQNCEQNKLYTFKKTAIDQDRKKSLLTCRYAIANQ